MILKILKVSAMKVPSMNDALKSNQIDGMLTYEPFVTTAVENGNMNWLIHLKSYLDIHAV